MAYPSTFLTLQDRVLEGMRLDKTADRNRVKDWINQVYHSVILSTRVNLRSGTATLTAGTASYELPSSVALIDLIAVKQPGQATYGPPLTPLALHDIFLRRYAAGGASQSLGMVTHYAFVQSRRLELWPTPAQNDTLYLVYLPTPTALSADGDLPALPEPYATYLLEAGARAEAAKFLGLDPTPEQRDYEVWLGKFRQHIRQREGGETRQLPFLSDIPFIPHDPSLDLRGLDT